jgi:ABC-type glycerol-3-phosphate transport system substrate-binding protein
MTVFISTRVKGWGSAVDTNAIVVGLITAVLGGSVVVIFQLWLQDRANKLAREKRRKRPTVFRSNLPNRDYVDFVGRTSEISTIMRVLQPDHRIGVVTIDGIGGIGKTTLAVEVAHRCREAKIFDAIVWMSAKRNVLTPDGIVSRKQTFSTFEDLCTVISQVLGSPEMLKGDATARQQLMQRTLAQERVLLVLDNLETIDDQQILNLLRELPTPSKALVTTRHRVDVAYDIHLGHMSLDESIRLMHRECEIKSLRLPDQDLRRLHKAAGGIPLAMVWCISQMAVRGRTLPSVLQGLGKADNDICQFCFRESVALLTSEERKALFSLALFEGPVERDVIWRVAGFGENALDNDDVLGRLVQLSLVSQAGIRFDMLPLARLFAKAELEKAPMVEQEIRERWVRSNIGREGALLPVTIYFPINVPGNLRGEIRSFVDRFNGMGTNIYVLPIFTGSYSETNEAIIRAARSGIFPDATILEVAQWLEMADRGLLLPLDSGIFPGGRDNLLREGYDPWLLSNVSLRGKVYGIPCNRSLPVIYYNRDKMNGSGLTAPDSPPKTWEDLTAYAKRLLQANAESDPDEFTPIGLPIDEDWFLACFTRQAGGKMLDDEGNTPKFNSVECIEALEFWASLCKDKLVKANDTWFQAPQDFLRGRSAMLFHSSASYRFLAANAEFGVGMWPLPFKRQPAVEIGGANFVILSNRPQEQQMGAWRFIDWFTQPAQTAEWAIRTGYLPVRSAAFQLEGYMSHVKTQEGMEAVVEQRQYAYPRASAPYFAKPRSLLLTVIGEVLRGERNSAEALSSIQQFAQERESEWGQATPGNRENF